MFRHKSCQLSEFYIKPQPCCRRWTSRSVVNYLNSTSNHNSWLWQSLWYGVVNYLNSTSNHNCGAVMATASALSIIWILHQTTTYQAIKFLLHSCQLSEFYIKPQPSQTNLLFINILYMFFHNKNSITSKEMAILM